MEHLDNIGISTNKKLVDLFNDMRNGILVLHPDFQRNLVWNDSHKENFLDTILRGFPFPEIYVADGELDQETLQHKVLVVDGQQRLSTIYNYIIGSSDLKLRTITPFSQLSEDQRNDFLYYTIVVRDLKNISREDIREVFKRINSVSYALNAMEIDNALYEGEYISTAKDIASELIKHEFGVFTENDEVRMKNVEYVLTIMTTVEIGAYFSNRKEVNEMIKQYDDYYYNKSNMTAMFTKIFTLIDDLELRFDSIWYTKTGMFTLLSELLMLMNQKKELPRKEAIEERLEIIEGEIRKENPRKEYAEFYYYCYQATGSKKGRTVRGELLRKELLNL